MKTRALAKRRFAVTAAMLLSSALLFVGGIAGADMEGNFGAADPHAFPLKGAMSGTTNILGACGDEGLLEIVSGKGVFTLTGASEASAVQCMDPTTGSSEGTGMLITANGDKIYVVYTHSITSFQDSRGTFDEQMTIIGGTGRFENATGEFTGSGSFTVIGWTVSWAVTYDGEVRR